MSIRRFHVKDLTRDAAVVDGAEAIHALRVLRLGIGDPVALFDGHGAEADAEIVAVGSDHFTARIRNRRHNDPAHSPLHLAVAVPKGERADWMVEKLAELGVSTMTPLLCDRSVVRPSPGKVLRWRRKALEAAKQAKTPFALDIRDPSALDDVLTAAPANARVWIADPDPEGTSFADALRIGGAFAEELVLIGPEGGWTADERQRIEARGGKGVRLAESILRVETAAMAVAVIRAATILDRPTPP